MQARQFGLAFCGFGRGQCKLGKLEHFAFLNSSLFISIFFTSGVVGGRFQGTKKDRRTSAGLNSCFTDGIDFRYLGWSVFFFVCDDRGGLVRLVGFQALL